MEVIKRDGRVVQYDPSKVRRAIREAFKAVDKEITLDDQQKVDQIAKYIDEFTQPTITVEEIQDFIEHKLMSSNRKDVAKSYIIYRNNRTIEREKKSTIVRKVARRINSNNVENSNANVDERSFSGREKEASADVFKTMATDYDGLSRRVAQAHKDMLVYQHDLEKAIVGEHNCEKETDWITYRNRAGIAKTIQFKELSNLYPIEDDVPYMLNDYAEVLGRNGWTKLEGISRRKLKPDEPIYEIKLRSGLPINLTGNHRVPVIRNGNEELIHVKDLQVGDEMLTIKNVPVDITDQDDGYINLYNIARKQNEFDYIISNTKKLEGWIHYKYERTIGQILGEDKKQATYQHKKLTVKQFEYLLSQVDIPYDVLLDLKIGAHGSKYSFPLIISYTPSLAKLYAYLYADGYIQYNTNNSCYQVQFMNTNIEIINDYIQCFEDVFKVRLNANKWQSDTSGCYRVSCGSRLLTQLFADWAGGYKHLAYDISLPDFIANGDESIKYAFLSAALDTDGSVSAKNFTYTTASDIYSDQIVKLFESLKINANKKLAWEKGSKVRFGSKVVERHSNGWNVTVENNEDIEKLSNKLSSWKQLEPRTKGFNKKLNYNKIKKINKKYEDCYVYDLQTASHWFVGNDIVVHNCLFLDFQEIFTNGFKTRNGDVRPPSSFSTACQLVAVAFQCQSQVQFGGVASMHLDYDLAPFIKMSFAKHLKDGIEYILTEEEQKDEFLQELLKNKSVNIENEYIKTKYPKLYKYAYNMLLKECKQSCEALYHNLNTLESRQGSQVPFTSINIGRDTTPEGRLVTKSILEASINGIGKYHLTSIFPISIFSTKAGINKNPGDPNYDLKQLALKSMSMRIYPNWCNGDWSQAHEDKNDIDTYFCTMGALAGEEHLYIKINNEQPMDISIKDLFDMLNNKTNIVGRPCNIIYDKPALNLPNDPDFRHHQGKKDFSVKSESGVYKITYIPEDVTYIGSSNNIKQRFNEHKKSIKYQGKLDCGICFADNNISNYKFEVVEYCEDYKDKEKHFIETIPNINIKGTSTKYFKNKGYKLTNNHIRPNIEMNPTVQQNLINLEDLDIKVFDIGNKWTKIKHIFKNDKMNTPLMISIQYLEYNKTYTLCCTEDHPLWTGKQFTRADELQVGNYLYRADGLKLPIINIQYHYDRKDSYDIGTETGTFIGSDIMMHNCRTLMGYDRHGLGYIRKGRGNNVPNTIILPKIAIENGICLGTRTEPDLDGFWKDLDRALRICEQGLLERYAIIKKQSPKAAPFMYQNNTIKDARNCNETVEEAVKHGTLGMGLIGIAEMCKALFGKTHDEDPEVHKFALSVVEHIYNYAKDASERNNLNFGCYFTPAESLCHTALKALREQYGVIEDVTSHEYLTNSCHVPVWHKISIYDKLRCEAPFTKYATSGCITYVELDSTFVKNTKAVEDIIDYAFDLDIPYLAFNFPIDSCLDCGHQGEFDNCCPECGSKNIQQLRRVTGYLTTDWHNFNVGKQVEVEERVKHSLIK